MMQDSPGKLFPERLHHAVPAWIKTGSTFHLRLRVAKDSSANLTDPAIATKILNAVEHYHSHSRWFCELLLIMPDHVHGLFAFPVDAQMSRVMGEWKKFIAQSYGVVWQTNYFDHRIRHDLESRETYDYILQNPVVKRLCSQPEDWPWVWRPK